MYRWLVAAAMAGCSGTVEDTEVTCAPTDEVCDGVDNDCDDAVDEQVCWIVDIASTTDLPVYGGSLGDDFLLSCPENHLATGVAGSFGDYQGFDTIFSLVLTCSELTGDGTLGGTSDAPAIGSSGPTPFTADCPAGDVIVQQSGAYHTGAIAQFGFGCMPLLDVMDRAPSAPVAVGPFGDLTSTTLEVFTDSCAPGALVTGYSGRAETVVNAIALRCTELTFE